MQGIREKLEKARDLLGEVDTELHDMGKRSEEGVEEFFLYASGTTGGAISVINRVLDDLSVIE